MRSLVETWDDLRKVHCEGDRLSILVTDAKTGKFKMIDARIVEVLSEGDRDFQEEVERWPTLKDKFETL